MLGRKILVIIFILSVWLLVSISGPSSSIYFPDFIKVWKRFFELIFSWGLYRDLLHTLARMYMAFVIAGVSGTWIGLWLGTRPKWFETAELPLEFLRALPSPVLFPLAVMFLGIEDVAKVAIAIYTCFFINLLYAFYGARDVDRAKLDFFHSLKVPRRDVVNRLLLWAALPSIFGGLRITLTVSLILIIIAEMLGGSPLGLGVRITNSTAPHLVPERYALILILGLTGFLTNWLFSRVEKSVVHWQGA
jgi:ABC-type nitrate/sulfonate/bicarbonate transport system permease component